MAEIRLNTTTSIVDALKAMGKDSSFGARKSLYESSGLKDRLGDYVGSASQNVAFLKNLQTPAQTTAIAPKSPVETPVTQNTTPTTTPEPTIGTSGITASQASSSIPQMPSADEILQNVLNSQGFSNFKQQQNLADTLSTGTAESQKQELEAKTATDTRTFINNMGRKGLFFSGETQDGIKVLGESLLSSKLDIDRKLAGDLLSSDLKTQEQIIKQVEEVVKDAQAGRKEALSSLEKVGLTVIGGEVVPTLAAQRESRLDEAELARRELADAKFEMAQAKNTQQMELATARLELAQARFQQTADKLTSAESKGLAATQLYGSTIQSVVDAGLTPQDALEAVNTQANATGVILDVETQNAVMQQAAILMAAKEKEKAGKPDLSGISLPAGPQNKLTDKPKTTTQPQKTGTYVQAPVGNPFQGFFNNLFKF